MNPNSDDVGPFRIDHLRSIWLRIARTAGMLQMFGAITMRPDALKQLVDATAECGNEVVDHPAITRTLRVLAAAEDMHAADWLRMKALEADLPRRRLPPAVDLQLRLRGLQATRIVAQLIRRNEFGRPENFRVTIRTTRGDVASVESTNFANALEGAIKMAGARAEGDPG